MSGLVTVSSYGRMGGSARVRIYDWIDFLELDARTVSYIESSSNSLSSLARQPFRAIGSELTLRTLSRTSDPNTILLSRRASPFSNGRIEAQILRNAEFGVYDYDDAISLTPKIGPQHLWSLASVWENSVRNADLVIAGNSYLANLAEPFAKEVVIIPSCVNHLDYTVKTDFSISSPRAVWIGSPSTEHFLTLIEKSLLRLNSELGLRLTVISSGDQNLGALDRMVDRVDWSEQTFPDELQRGDFGIMPLTDDPWTRGKCAYKLLQYGASALPLVGSPVGANQDVLELAEAHAPESQTDWYDSIKSLLALSSEDRSALGTKARDAVVEHYSFQAWASSWRSATRL